MAYEAYIWIQFKMLQYYPIFWWLLLGVVLSLILILGSYLLANQQGDNEKFSAYECGFDPIGDARKQFQIQFFLVGILFIVMDLEVALLFPWSVLLDVLSWSHMMSITIFLMLLILGLAYEWLKGGLEWLEV